MKELQGLGYQALAYGFYEDDIQVSFTKDCESCMEHSIVEYIESVIIASKEISSLDASLFSCMMK